MGSMFPHVWIFSVEPICKKNIAWLWLVCGKCVNTGSDVNGSDMLRPAKWVHWAHNRAQHQYIHKAIYIYIYI